ncbi:hypothetical protein [Rhodoplanes roseus]|uniref:hypothetical protein n=1 Tax=Rhodoplanes roseus TaxID=29409 RepID=UPI00269354E8
MVRAIKFGIDGTLIDSVDAHAESWVRAFAKFGVETDFDDVRRHIGMGADRLMPAFASDDLLQKHGKGHRVLPFGPVQARIPPENSSVPAGP